MNALSYICSSRIGGRIDPPVKLVAAPWNEETMTPDPRPETAPPRGIKSKRNGVTPEGFIALLRAECLKARPGA